MSALRSTATVTAVGLTCKAFLNSGLCALTVNGINVLKDALATGNGVITVCNHISTLDDPVTWGILPVRWYLSSRTTRWSLGASDVMFTNPVFSSFFSLGQTLETFRGKGIYQEAVDTAIQKLNQGHWVHLYSEGKITQQNAYIRDKDGRICLPRFKWGVGRILMEANIQPVVIPMWLTGFDQLMPEGRAFPYKYLPCMGANLSVTFGDPVPAHELTQALASRTARSDIYEPSQPDEKCIQVTTRREECASLVRQEVTTIIHRHVEALGRRTLAK